MKRTYQCEILAKGRIEVLSKHSSGFRSEIDLARIEQCDDVQKELNIWSGSVNKNVE